MTEGLSSKMAVGIFCFSWDSACNLDNRDALTWIWPLKRSCVLHFPVSSVADPEITAMPCKLLDNAFLMV